MTQIRFTCSSCGCDWYAEKKEKCPCCGKETASFYKGNSEVKEKKGSINSIGGKTVKYGNSSINDKEQ
jgi:hypothetical protein